MGRHQKVANLGSDWPRHRRRSVKSGATLTNARSLLEHSGSHLSLVASLTLTPFSQSVDHNAFSAGVPKICMCMSLGHARDRTHLFPDPGIARFSAAAGGRRRQDRDRAATSGRGKRKIAAGACKLFAGSPTSGREGAELGRRQRRHSRIPPCTTLNRTCSRRRRSP